MRRQPATRFSPYTRPGISQVGGSWAAGSASDARTPYSTDPSPEYPIVSSCVSAPAPGSGVELRRSENPGTSSNGTAAPSADTSSTMSSPPSSIGHEPLVDVPAAEPQPPVGRRYAVPVDVDRPGLVRKERDGIDVEVGVATPLRPSDRPRVGEPELERDHGTGAPKLDVPPVACRIDPHFDIGPGESAEWREVGPR